MTCKGQTACLVTYFPCFIHMDIDYPLVEKNVSSARYGLRINDGDVSTVEHPVISVFRAPPRGMTS